VIQAVPPRPGDIATSANAKRRVVAAANSARPVEDDDQPAWLKARPEQSSAQRANAKFGVPTGAHIRARLLTNLDSRTVGAGPVEAKLMRPFLLDGRSVVPVWNGGSSGTPRRLEAASRFGSSCCACPDNRKCLSRAWLRRRGAQAGPGSNPQDGGAPNKTDGLASKIVKETANTVLTAAK